MNTTRTPTANRFSQSIRGLTPYRCQTRPTNTRPDSHRGPAPRGWESCSYFMRWLRDTYLASDALKVGDTTPGFLLLDTDGLLHSSEQLRRNGPSS
jgi:hypothetical protein